LVKRRGHNSESARGNYKHQRLQEFVGKRMGGAQRESQDRARTKKCREKGKQKIKAKFRSVTEEMILQN
jgi:hypothetical protein